jgi:hypothetical protein
MEVKNSTIKQPADLRAEATFQLRFRDFNLGKAWQRRGIGRNGKLTMYGVVHNEGRAVGISWGCGKVQSFDTSGFPSNNSQ